jgi:hypothetical protein
MNSEDDLATEIDDTEYHYNSLNDNEYELWYWNVIKEDWININKEELTEHFKVLLRKEKIR